MNIHIKSALILLTTLLIGIIIGALGMNLFRNQRQVNFENFREQKAFMHLHEGILQPTSEAQRDSIHKILTQNLPKFRELGLKHRAEMSALIDSMQKQLAPILTKEQLERLNNRRSFIQRPRRGEPPMEGMGPRPPWGVPSDSIPPRWERNNKIRE
ncbi:hypothetical protein JXQ31_07205 [candidate division KSB1 bacterium]|nr:hypothetical protein [candidate division KSB1 bacterium]